MKALAEYLRLHARTLECSDRDTHELISVLARIVEGKDSLRAFGAPGDWGYDTPLGKALQEALKDKLTLRKPVSLLPQEAIDGECFVRIGALCPDERRHLLGLLREGSILDAERRSETETTTP